MTTGIILIVEDEPRVARLLADYLQSAGYQTHCIHHGDEVMPWLEDNTPDLILLDLMLPGTNGESICRAIRERSMLMPIIIITAKVEEDNRIEGLELGADDYMCKPLSPREVVARVRAALRRLDFNASSSKLLELDANRLLVCFNNEKVQITSIEFQLIKTLVAQPGRIYSREQLMDCLYNDHRIVHDRTVDGHVKKLRIKLKKLFGDQDVIQSVYGAGYRFEPPQATT